MKKKLFEEPVSEYEMLAESNQKAEEQIHQRPSRTQRTQVIQELMEEIDLVYPDEETAYELEDDQQDIVNEAMVRLEQARLYEMLIKHDIFDGVEGNPIALQNVQAELKEYIVERLQILLGIKAETVKTRPSSMRVELPFNRMEIDALKDLANKLTKGASSESQEKETVEAVEEEQEEETPKPPRAPKKLQGLKPLGGGKLTQPIKQVAQPTRTLPPQQRSPSKQSNVVVNKTKRKVSVPEYRGGTMIDPKSGEKITEEEIQIAREQLEQDLAVASGKNPYEMTEDELIARNSRIKTQAVSKKVARLPMPSPDMVAMHYQQQSANRLEQQEDSGLTTILGRVLNSK